MSIDLKPCPFCGGDAALGNDTLITKFVRCKHCEACSGSHIGERNEAIKAWNTRHEAKASEQPVGLPLDPTHAILKHLKYRRCDDEYYLSREGLAVLKGELLAMEIKKAAYPPKREVEQPVEHNCRYKDALDAAHKVFAAEVDSMQKKSDEEMLRVKMCEHIAEGEDGWNKPKCRNICPSTMAVADLRDKYEALLEREYSKDNDESHATVDEL